MQTKIIERYFFFGLLLLTLFLAFLIFKPFLPIMLISAAFAVVLSPVHKWLKKRGMPNGLAALLTLFFFILIICGPLFGLGVLVFNQTHDLYYSMIQNGGTGPVLQKIETTVNGFLPGGISFDLNEKVSEFIVFMTRNVAAIFTSTLSTLFGFFLTLVSIFFFLKDGSHWKKELVLISPLADRDDGKILDRLTQSINGIVKGYLLIAVIQGTLMGVGLAVAGVPSAALWGVIAGIGSLLPTVGTALVSIPAVIFLVATGHVPQAIGMGIWAFMIVGWVDNLLNPIVISSKIKIPHILVLFSVLGGLAFMGPVGFLFGPLIVSLLYALITIYRDEYEDKKEELPV